jgi:hypothetical protein
VNVLEAINASIPRPAGRSGTVIGAVRGGQILQQYNTTDRHTIGRPAAKNWRSLHSSWTHYKSDMLTLINLNNSVLGGPALPPVPSPAVVVSQPQHVTLAATVPAQVSSVPSLVLLFDVIFVRIWLMDESNRDKMTMTTTKKRTRGTGMRGTFAGEV